MNRALAGALVLAAALVLFGALFLLRAPRHVPAAATAPGPSAPSGVTEGTEGTAAPPAAPAPVLEETRQVTLWLPAPGGLIAPTTIELASAPEPAARIDALLRALFAATPAPPLSPLFAGEVKLVATMRGADATLYVDLGGADGAEPPGSGSELELQRVYSIVHTVVRNEPSVERVVLLWNGAQRLSLAGHVDTGHPLVPRPELEAGAEAKP